MYLYWFLFYFCASAPAFMQGLEAPPYFPTSNGIKGLRMITIPVIKMLNMRLVFLIRLVFIHYSRSGFAGLKTAPHKR